MKRHRSWMNFQKWSSSLSKFVFSDIFKYFVVIKISRMISNRVDISTILRINWYISLTVSRFDKKWIYKSHWLQLSSYRKTIVPSEIWIDLLFIMIVKLKGKENILRGISWKRTNDPVRVLIEKRTNREIVRQSMEKSITPLLSTYITGSSVTGNFLLWYCVFKKLWISSLSHRNRDQSLDDIT